MPLQRKCDHCGQVLHLDDAFAGASCRCQFCSHFISLPRTSASSRNGKRPVRPTLAATTAGSPALIQAAHRNAVAHRPTATTWTSARRTVSALLLAAVVIGVGLTVTINRKSESKRATLVATVTPAVESSASEEFVASADPQQRILAGDVRSSFFGIPLKGETIGYVIDGDATMAPFIDEVAFITNSVNEAIPSSSRKFGIVMAVNNGGKMLVEISEPSSNLDGARSILLARVPGGKTRLQSALAATTNWYADQLFMIVSKPIQPAFAEVLAQSAAQTGAVTHVIALGEAANQDLSSIARNTGGEFVAVSDANLEKLVQRHTIAKDAVNP
jgi:hypothetical protein